MSDVRLENGVAGSERWTFWANRRQTFLYPVTGGLPVTREQSAESSLQLRWSHTRETSSSLPQPIAPLTILAIAPQHQHFGCIRNRCWSSTASQRDLGILVRNQILIEKRHCRIRSRLFHLCSETDLTG